MNLDIFIPRCVNFRDLNSSRTRERGLVKTLEIHLEKFLSRGQKISPREIDISSVFFEVLTPQDFTPRSRVLAFSKPIFLDY